MARKEYMRIRFFRLAFLWGFIALLIAGLSFLAPRKTHAASVDEPAIAEIPLCDTAEQIRFLVIEADHHGQANAVQASGELYGKTACAYAIVAYVRGADASAFVIRSGVVTIASVHVYGVDDAGRWVKIRPSLPQFSAFVTGTQEASLPIGRVHGE
jgi:hypothetical protein